MRRSHGRLPTSPGTAARLSWALLFAVAGCIFAVPAGAQTAADGAENPCDTSGTLLGDLSGRRSALCQRGITLGLSETSEVKGNVTGGQHTGFDYNGVTTLTLGLDTGRAFGWAGGTFNVSALQIHGRSLAADNTLNLQVPSGIEGARATRLWELWYQQQFFGGRADIKVGQQSVDTEFMTSTYSALFLNTVMGWPMLPSADLYAGGPAYPLSSLGVRLRATPMDNVTVLAGVFDDNPPGGPFDDDGQLRGAEASGTRFNTGTGALIIGEVQYALNPAGDDKKPAGLPGTYRVGFWYDTGSFPDDHFDSNGRSLADPASNGMPMLHRHDFSLYGSFDQMVWRPDPAGARALGVFLRIMGAQDNCNLIDFAADAGITLKAPFAGRDDDTIGLGYGFAEVSDRAAALDRNIAQVTGLYHPVRSSESFVELTYQAQVTPWWQMQPDLQYVFMPGGGIVNPSDPTRRVGNELILGLRTNIVF